MFTLYVIKKNNKLLINNNIKTNSPAGFADDYVNSWKDILFDKGMNENLNYIITYHNVIDFPYHNNYFNLVVDGEPNDISNIRADMLISTKKNPNNKQIKNILYVPYFVHFLIRINKDPELVLIKKPDEIIPKKTKFCSFAYSNCDEKFQGVKNRKQFYKKIQEITNNRVDNLGVCYNTKYKYTGDYKNNNITFQDYKFVICFENQEIDGYISEKLVVPMLCRSIPIYLGAPDIGNYFNTKSFINVRDFKSYEDCINYVLKVDNDQALYEKILREPYFKDNKIDKDLFSLYYGGEFYRKIEKLLPLNISKYIKPYKLFSENIFFITFSDGIVYKTDRIVNEAKNSGFFKEIKAYSPKYFDNEFKSKHLKFILENKKGYGYWIWKPYINLKILEKMSYGDICIYCDSGMVINSKGYDRVKYYYKLIEKNNDMLCFGLNYNEREWIKKDTLNNVLKYKNVDMNKFENYVLNIEEKQRMTGIFMYKKTKKVENFFKDWYALCENYHNIDDSPSVESNFPSFKENRHDQSVFSILSKIYNFISLYDNKEDYNKNYEKFKDGAYRPFLPYRRKN